jgi:hypothetical protein
MVVMILPTWAIAQLCASEALTSSSQRLESTEKKSQCQARILDGLSKV